MLLADMVVRPDDARLQMLNTTPSPATSTPETSSATPGNPPPPGAGFPPPPRESPWILCRGREWTMAESLNSPEVELFGRADASMQGRS